LTIPDGQGLRGCEPARVKIDSGVAVSRERADEHTGKGKGSDRDWRENAKVHGILPDRMRDFGESTRAAPGLSGLPVVAHAFPLLAIDPPLVAVAEDASAFARRDGFEV
jgi:hypothetical protein